MALDGCVLMAPFILWTGHLCSWCLLYLPGSSVVRGAGSCGLLQAQAGPSHREAAQEDAHEVEGDGRQVSCTAGHTAAHFRIGFCSCLCEMMGVISCSSSVLTCLHCFLPFSWSSSHTLNVSKVGNSHLCQCLTTFIVQNFVLLSTLNFPSFRLKPSPLVLAQQTLLNMSPCFS